MVKLKLNRIKRIICSTCKGNGYIKAKGFDGEDKINQCLPPVEHKGSYPDLYTCLNAGYEESIVQLQKIGAVDVNEKRIFIKFFCSPTQET